MSHQSPRQCFVTSKLSRQALWLCFLFYLVVSTTEDFFTPALSKLSDKLQFSSNVTGVTLLAFSNGTPDFITSFSALSHGAAGLGFGALLGAGMFVTTIVLATVCVSSKVSNITRRPFFRDTGVYLAIVVVIFAIVHDGQITLWESILFITLYFGYIIGVVVARLFYQRREKKRRAELGIVEDITDELLEVSEDGVKNEGESSSYPMLDEALFVSNIKSWRAEKRRSAHGELLFGFEDHSCTGVIRSWISRFSVSISWQEKNARQKVFYIIVAPSIFLRNLTIPLVADGQYSRFFTVVNPVCIPLFVFLATGDFFASIPIGSFHLPVAVILLNLGIIFSLIVLKTTEPDEPPKYTPLLVLISFIMSVFWLYLIATEIVCILRALGRIAHVSEQILGLTFVAWSNSIIDLVANTVVARQGFQIMAVSACYGAPAFNLLLGTGISLTYVNIMDYPRPFTIYFTKHLLIGFIFLIVSILSSLIIIPVSRFRGTKKFAVYLVILYSVFAVINVLVELNIIPQ